MPLLSISNLSIAFHHQETKQDITVVENLCLSLGENEILGLVGESGSGKSITALAIMGLLPQPAGKHVSGEILLHNKPVVPTEVRGKKIAMIFQEPMTALNPVHTIGKQLLEVFLLHQPQLSRQQQIEKAVYWLKRVGIPEAEQRMAEYPHQLSGGMRQRVLIAMALAIEPDILIADEPTTALDVTIQGQILSVIKELQTEINMSVIFITHDLGVVFNLCDRIAVMYAGSIIESAATIELFKKPLHPYTQGLLNAIPSLQKDKRQRLATIEGQVPAPGQWPMGCRFHPRCSYATSLCQQSPTLEVIEAHQVACHHWREIKRV